jgi:hypothetical protein
LNVTVFTFIKEEANFDRDDYVYGELAGTLVEAILGVPGVFRAITVLSCCFQFGRVGIVL